MNTLYCMPPHERHVLSRMLYSMLLALHPDLGFAANSAVLRILSPDPDAGLDDLDISYIRVSFEWANPQKDLIKSTLEITNQSTNERVKESFLAITEAPRPYSSDALFELLHQQPSGTITFGRGDIPS